MVKRALAGLLLALALGLAALTGDAARAQATEGWAYDLMNELMSPYCPGRLLSDCPSPQAQTLRMWLIVQEASRPPARRGRGRGGRALRRVDPGRAARRRLRARGLRRFPLASFLAGGALLTWFLRRQTRSAPTPDSVAPSAPLDPELERLVDEKLAER